MKDLSKTLVVKELINSLILIKQQPFWLVMAALADAVFFIAWGFFTSPVRNKIVEHAVLIANQLSTIMAGQELPSGILEHMLSPALRPMTAKLTIIILTLFVTIYVLYTAFHGTSWWMAAQIAKKDHSYRKYLLGFAKINLLWLLLYTIYKFLDVIVSVRHVVIEKILPGTPNIGAGILFAALLFLGITAVFSYPLLKAKTLFKIPINISAPLIVISASLFLATQFILNLIGKLNVDAALAAGLLLLFPVMTLIRVYITRVITNVHTRD
jgi:hypothetical protein